MPHVNIQPITVGNPLVIGHNPKIKEGTHILSTKPHSADQRRITHNF
jgi:phosphohistidine phosphatase SixA